MAQHIVHFCETQTADTDTTMAFRALSEHGVNIYIADRHRRDAHAVCFWVVPLYVNRCCTGDLPVWRMYALEQFEQGMQ